MTKPSTDRAQTLTGQVDPDDRPDYESMADWAQSPAAEAFAVAAATNTRAQRNALQEQMRSLLTDSLPQDPARDTPAEAFTRAELAKTGRGPGRPSLAVTTGTAKPTTTAVSRTAASSPTASPALSSRRRPGGDDPSSSRASGLVEP